MARNHLTNLIKSLNKEEVRNFSIYINRINTKINSAKSNKKILSLFKAIREGADEFDDNLMLQFYSINNKNAYYRLKNRLIKEIEYSLLMLNRQKDERSKILNNIQLARFFSYKSAYETAIYYLKKAEKQANNSEYYDLLNIIYDEFIVICSRYDKINPADYLAKKANNLYKYTIYEKINTLLAKVNYKLKKTNFSGRSDKVIDELNRMVESVQLDKHYQESAILKMRVFDCVTEVLLQKKDFPSLENYTIEQLSFFEKNKLFNNANFESKIVMLVWIINASIKNRKFQQALDYIDQLGKSHEDSNQLYYKKYMWLSYQSRVICYSFLGRNLDAIQELEEVKKIIKAQQTIAHSIFLYLNLATCYYCGGNVDKALDYLKEILAYDTYKKLSTEWQLAVSFIEIILRIESKDFDYTAHRLAETKRIFRTHLKAETYERERDFLDILKEIVSNPQPFKSKKFIAKATHFIAKANMKTFELASNEGINYQIWLESKIHNQDYYKILLEKVKPQDQQQASHK